MRVVLLTDRLGPAARPDEVDAEVQCRELAALLAARGDSIARVAIDLDLAATAERLRAAAPDVVFNLAESVGGRGRLVHLAPALLDEMGLPYTGCGTLATILAAHKTAAKRLLRAHGLPTPDWWEGPPSPAAPGRYLVKGVWEEASLGIDDEAVLEAAGPADLACALARRRPLVGDEVFAEVLVEGREFNVALLECEAGPEVLPVAELRFLDYPPGKPRIAGYAAKWEPDSFEYGHTVRRFDLPLSDGPLAHALEGIARGCWEAFSLRGYARVDVRVDGAGQPFVLEVNANPALAADAGFLAAARQAGLDPGAVVDRLLEAALAGARGLRA